jgi:hypothetical protein
MALHAVFQPWYTGKGPIITKAMTIGALFGLGLPFKAIYPFRVHVDGMTEIYRLRVPGIESHRKDKPTDNQGRYETREKIDRSAPKGVGNHIRVKGDDEIDKRIDKRRKAPTIFWSLLRETCLIFHRIEPHAD